MRKVTPFATFLLFLVLWTWKLLDPHPVPEDVNKEIPTDLKFYLAKMLHASAYAFLTILASLLPIRRLYFWLVVASLAIHGVVTEILQAFVVVNRNGSVRDVLIDWAGITVGLLIIRWWNVRCKVSSGAQ